MTAKRHKLNIDDISLAVEHAKSLLELLEDRFEDDDTKSYALLGAVLKELEVIQGEIDKAIGPVPADVPVMSVAMGVH